jgi:hypothetical protein
MHNVWCAPGQQQNVTGAHGEALTIRKLHSARSLQHNVIGRFPQGFLFVISSPISTGLGIVELLIGLLVLSNPISRRTGLLGGALAFGTPLVTLSFLITTPEAWVGALGDAQHGFPYLSGGGRLVLKDVLMLAGSLPVMADSARQLLRESRA